MTWSKKSSGTGYSPSNQSTLDKLSDNGTGLLFNGSPVNVGTSIPSKWAGKKWYVIGDSITEHNTKTTTNYHDYIAQSIGCIVTNYGLSGTGYSVNGGYTNGSFYQRTVTGVQPNSSLPPAFDANADLVTVFGGTNDWANSPLVLGALGDTSPTASFYGAVDKTIINLISNYPLKTIAVFTPLPRDTTKTNYGTNSNLTLGQIADAIIQVCSKYSIPVLDLYRVSNFYPFNATQCNNDEGKELPCTDQNHGYHGPIFTAQPK